MNNLIRGIVVRNGETRCRAMLGRLENQGKGREMNNLIQGIVGLKGKTERRAILGWLHNHKRENVMTTFRTSTGVITAFAFAIALSFAPPARGQTWLIDFGDNISFRGTNTPSPDSNGHYWNSVHYAYVPSLIDINGNSTSAAYGLDALGGTDSYNGPAGDTSAGVPLTIGNTLFNPGALGNLGQTNAVCDYFVNAKFQIQGLDPTKQYKLTFFRSHKYNTDNTTVYSVCDSTYSTVLASTSLLVGVNDAHNQDTVAVINNVSPQANTIMYIKFLGSAGNDGYLNDMQLEVVPEPATVTLISLGLLSVMVLRRRHTS